MESKIKVCVTGGSGFIGSSLIKKLLDKGAFVVHATLRNLGDTTKVGLLKRLPNAETRLKLFEADIYNPQQFEAAVKDCQFVFHVATPFVHINNSQYKDTVEAAVAGVKSIAMSCIRSGTVKRLIYTASVTAASPLKEDGSGYMDVMDESCWTSLNLPLDFLQDFEKGYMISKTLAEKEVLKFGATSSSEYGGSLEVVILACGQIGGDTLLSYTPASVLVIISQLPVADSKFDCRLLKVFLENLLGKIPIVHIDDVIDAHIFCMEQDSISGRFLCACDYVSSSEIAEYYKQNFPEFHVKQEHLEGPKRSIKWEQQGSLKRDSGGDTLLSYTPASVLGVISQLAVADRHSNASLIADSMFDSRMLKEFLENLLGKIPIAHIGDVIDAHIFCMEQDSITGRFLCACGCDYVSSSEIAEYYKQNFPEFHVKQENLEGPKRSIKWGATKLIEKGFKFHCDLKKILDDSVKCARRFGVL